MEFKILSPRELQVPDFSRASYSWFPSHSVLQYENHLIQGIQDHKELRYISHKGKRKERTNRNLSLNVARIPLYDEDNDEAYDEDLQ